MTATTPNFDNLHEGDAPTMIDYEFVEQRGTFKVRVRLNGRVVGAIKVVDGGFAYFPGNSRQHGDVFKTVKEVQRSLEGDDDDTES